MIGIGFRSISLAGPSICGAIWHENLPWDDDLVTLGVDNVEYVYDDPKIGQTTVEVLTSSSGHGQATTTTSTPVWRLTFAS